MTAVLGRTTVHPRMDARRIAVQRDQGRRRRRWLIGIAALLGIAAGLGIFLQSSLVDVDRVEVVGAERTPRELILETAGIAPGASLLSLDLGPASEAIAELPWVAEVNASVSWTGDVLFQVTERIPVAQVATETGYSVVDADGRVVSFSGEPYPGLAVVLGVAGAGAGGWLPAAALDPVAVAAAIGPDLQTHVVSVSADQGGDLYLELNRGGRARLGDTRDLEDKLVAVETLIAQADLSCLSVMDVRAASAPVITRAC